MGKFISRILVKFILKITAIPQNIKNELDNNILISLSECMRRSSELLKEYNILYNNIEDYVHGHKLNIKRILMVTIPETSFILTWIRCFIMIFNTDPFLKILFNDFVNQMDSSKSSRIFTIIISMALLVNYSIVLVFHNHEFNRKLNIVKYLNDLIENKPAIDLSYSRHRRLTLGLHLMTKYVFPVIHRLTTSSGVLLFTALSFVFLPDGGSFGSTLVAIIWILPTYFTIKICLVTLNLGTIFGVFIMVYIKYLFNTIEDNIKLCLKCRNSKLVIKAINEHRIAEQMCRDANELLKIINFILYFVASPAHMLNIYYISGKNNPVVLRIFMLTFFVMAYSMNVGLILINSQITRSAHSTRKYFFRYLDSTSLPFERRMKIMLFIEKLCGTDIGFYCWDWFPLNSFEFYKYCAFCVSLFIMSSGFFS